MNFRFFNFGGSSNNNKQKAGGQKSPVPSPSPKRRGSTNSDIVLAGPRILSHHSYSTGNLQQLDPDTPPNVPGRYVVTPLSVLVNNMNSSRGGGPESRLYMST
ncbi:unnamed protein product [Owenia fusiformis]|uniref:Uncharacterized protein n=1 Tax=Owenia fusiformis TaxID=6347 RepID=A0A8S4PP97_OWEFU|nr:unnamed protein product [Owenia fusiformis]